MNSTIICTMKTTRYADEVTRVVCACN